MTDADRQRELARARARRRRQADIYRGFLVPDAEAGRFFHSAVQSIGGGAMSGAESIAMQIATALSAGRQCTPLLGHAHEIVAFIGGRSALREDVAKLGNVKELLLISSHGTHPLLRAGNITLLETACGAHAAGRIQTRNLSDRKR